MLLDRPAVQAVHEVLADYGIKADRCGVLQDGSTLVLRLTETLVVRVVQDASGPRTGVDWFARENAVVDHLTRTGAPVIPLHPDLPPGPHERHGYPMTFWRFVTVTGRKPEAHEAGRALRVCHASLATMEGSLPRLAILHESLGLVSERALFPADTTELLNWHLQEALTRLEGGHHQALHGDAHLGNALDTTEGLLWTDWEDAFVGPVEWDVASLIWNAKLLEGDEATVQAMMSGYEAAGGKMDAALLQVCLEARAAVMCAWYPLLYPNPDASRKEKLAQRLDWLSKMRP